MVLKVAAANNVRVYTVSGAGNGTSLPDWLARKKRRALRDDPEYSSRIELLQDFEFPQASNRIKTTADGNFAMATGTYKPQIHVYEYAELGLKFSRHTDAENVNFCLLSDDWTKSIHLQSDRSIEFQAQGSLHYKVRIPKFGRDLAYHSPSCDLYVSAAGNEIYRLNLEQGRFLNPMATDIAAGVNTVNINPVHHLLMFGGDDGTIEFWDPRSRSRVIGMDVHAHIDESNLSISAASFRGDGLSLAVGTSSGHTLLYDLRSPQPWLQKDQGYGAAVKSLHWLETQDATRVLSADSTIIKIWDRNDGKPFTSIEPSVAVNDVCPLPGTGMIFVANEGISMHSYYVPLLGPSPRWCRFLDNLTEELEETPAATIYDNYKFVTKQELSSLGLGHLLGSNLVRSYMHGYFIDLQLYEKARLIANPFMYEEHRAKKIQEKIEKERDSRIRAARPRTKVNRGLAERLVRQEAKKHGQDGASGSILEDPRFKGVFEDPEFQVDEDSLEFQQLNPAKSSRPLTAAEESDLEDEVDNAHLSSPSTSESEEEEDEEEEVNEIKQRKSAPRKAATTKVNGAKKPAVKLVPQGAKNLGRQEKSFAEQLETFQPDLQNTKRALPVSSQALEGDMEITFEPTRKAKADKHGNEAAAATDNDEQRHGKQAQRVQGRRSASKNVFRKM